MLCLPTATVSVGICVCHADDTKPIGLPTPALRYPTPKYHFESVESQPRFQQGVQAEVTLVGALVPDNVFAPQRHLVAFFISFLDCT